MTLNEKDKLRVIFVDDESMIVDGLRRNLRRMRKVWDMHFCLSGPEALALVADGSFDVIVTDMRMPGMDGAELLSKIQQAHPHMVRIILSGYSQQESILRSVNIAHRYLSKPTEPEHIQAVITRCWELRKRLKSDNLMSMVAGIQTLPVQPQTYHDLLECLKSVNSSTNDVSQIIESDAGMTAKILKMVNSSFFGLRQKVTNVSKAISFIGLEMIKSLVMTSHIFDETDQNNDLGPNFSHHAHLVAIMSRRIMEIESTSIADLDDTFTAGMLHDVGKLILYTHLGSDYDQAIHSGGGSSQQSAERIHLGFNHAEIGGYLLAIWGLPDAIVEAVTYHHLPNDCQHTEFTPLTAVHIANACFHLKHNPTKESLHDLLCIPYIERLGIGHKLADYSKICNEVLTESSTHV